MIVVNLKPKNQAKKMPLEGCFQEHLVSGLVSAVPNSRLKAPKYLNLFGGDDETRTRDLRRDRPAF